MRTILATGAAWPHQPSNPPNPPNPPVVKGGVVPNIIRHLEEHKRSTTTHMLAAGVSRNLDTLRRELYKLGQLGLVIKSSQPSATYYSLKGQDMNTNELIERPRTVSGNGELVEITEAEQRQSADEIDRLTHESVAADLRIGNDALMIAELTAERDSLQAKYTEACQHVVKVECEHGTTLGELTELRAKLTALEGAYIPTYLERLAASPATLEAEFTALRSEALDLRAALAERDAKLAALEAQEPVAWKWEVLPGAPIAKYQGKNAGVYFEDPAKIRIDINCERSVANYKWTLLYAAAGAAPVPLTKAQVDDVVYQCRRNGKDTTYDIVNAAIALTASPKEPT